MDGDWVQLLTRHFIDYHPRGPNSYGMALSVIWPGQVHPRNCWFPIAVQWAAIVEIFQDDQSSDLAWWLAGVYNLVKDDIKSIYRKMRAHVNWELLKWILFTVLEAWVTALYSCLRWRESESHLPKLHPQISLTKWNDLRGSPIFWDHVIDEDHQTNWIIPRHPQSGKGC